MKKIGLVGGISWTSTLDYYKLINEGINAKLGGFPANVITEVATIIDPTTAG